MVCAGWMGVNLLTQGSDSSKSGPLLTAMQSFGSGVEEGLTSLKTAVQSYNDSQAQAVLAAFDAEFCTDAEYVASSQKPLNFTGENMVQKYVCRVWPWPGQELGTTWDVNQLLVSCFAIAECLDITTSSCVLRTLHT